MRPTFLQRVTGRFAAAALVVAAAALAGGCSKPEPLAAPVPRPVQTMTLGAEMTLPPHSYPGKVLAGQRVSLAFEVSGKLQELAVKEGDRIAAGAVVARLDPRDFQNALDGARAELDRARANFERVQEAAKINAVSQQDLSNAKASMDVAQAQCDIRQKALDDTELKAPFEGVIATRYVESFENVLAKQQIVSLQNFGQIEIEVFIPENRLAGVDPTRFQQRDAGSIAAVFDALPQLEFPLSIKEFSTEADPTTQMFRAVLTMPAPENYLILPGMTVTVRVVRRAAAGVAEDAGFLVPFDAVAVDAPTGKQFVWIVQRQADGGDLATVTKRFVEVGEPVEESLLVRSGLAAGDVIAVAGVSVLLEGQVVKPFAEEPGRAAL